MAFQVKVHGIVEALETPMAVCSLSDDPAVLGLSDSSQVVPERHLLLAILQRAYSDLLPGAPEDDCNDALAWFLDETTRPFSYNFVKTHIELGSLEKLIQQRIHDALHRH